MQQQLKEMQDLLEKQIEIVKDKNPRIGTDCKISTIGIIIFSSLLDLAASTAKTIAKIKENNITTNILSTVNAAYLGR